MPFSLLALVTEKLDSVKCISFLIHSEVIV